MRKPAWLTKNRLCITCAVLAVVGAIGLLIYRPGWTGFGPDSTKSAERDSTGKIIKIVEFEQSGKTLWDWLSVLGVPLSLALLGVWLQRREQERIDRQAEVEKRRAEEQAQLEREIAEANQREEALQAYFDRLSTLLVDKNLIAVAAKVKEASENSENQQDTEVNEQKELLDAAVDVIRARTLSILRQFKEDGERKRSVIQFLIETEIISRLKLNLSDADLSHIRLYSANLSGTNLSRANISHTFFDNVNLSGANLSRASISYSAFTSVDLSKAILREASLSDSLLALTNLREADCWHAWFCNTSFSGVDLNDANLNGADLSGADLEFSRNWTEKQLASALLCRTKLPEKCTLDPDRHCKVINPPEADFSI